MPYTRLITERMREAQVRAVTWKLSDLVRRGLAVAVLAAVGAAVEHAADPSTVAHAQAPHALDLVGQTGGLAADVIMAGEHAWVGVGPRVVAWDVSVPSVPRWIGESPVLSGVVLDIAVAGGRPTRSVFAVTGEGGIEVIDVTDAVHPRRLSYLDMSDGVTEVAAGDDVVCVAVASDPPMVWVVDVANPAAPWVASRIELPAEAIGLVAAERRVYVLVDDEGLRIYDLATPASPLLIGRAPTPDRESGLGGRMDLASGYVFVADGPNGLRVFDVVDPSAPREVGRLTDVNDARAVHVANGLAYVADGARGLAVVEVASPRNPRLLGRHVTNGAASSVAAVDDLVMVTDEHGLRVIDASNPGLPRRSADIDPPGYVVGVAAEGDRWFAFDGTHALLWSIAGDGLRTARATSHVASPVTGSDGGALAAHAGYVYVAGGREGLGVIDARGPSGLAAIGVVTGTTAMDVHAAGRHVYVAAGGDGLAVLDATDPARPRPLSAAPTDGFASAVFAQVSRTLVMDGSLEVFDTRDPARPGAAATLAMEGDLPGTVAAEGERAYAATDRVHVFDLTTPGNPAVVGEWMPESGPLVSPRIAVGEGVAYVSDAFNNAVWALDVAGNEPPRELARAVLPAGSQPLDMMLARVGGTGVVLVASGDGGVTVWRHRASGGGKSVVYLPFGRNR